MKKITQTLILIISIFWTAGIQTSAMNFDLSDAVITADEGGLVIMVDEESGAYVDLDDLAPGSSINRSYVIRNDYVNAYQLYLRVTNPVSIPAESDIVNKIMLKITFNGAVEYDGPVGGGYNEKGYTLDNNIRIGEISGGSERRLQTEFYLDGELIGNESQHAAASVDWIWSAIIPNGVVEPEKPDVEKPSTEVPEIKKPQPVPGPKTGDTVIFSAFILAAAAAILVLLAGRKKNQMKVVGME